MGVLGVYCRISNKRENYSLDEQKRMGIEVCKNNGFEYRHYEEVESGVKGGLGRKHFKKMMSLVEEGVLDGVLIFYYLNHFYLSFLTLQSLPFLNPLIYPHHILIFP